MVGSGAKLKGSKLKSVIDSHEVVWRFNRALGDVDVGFKTDYRVVSRHADRVVMGPAEILVMTPDDYESFAA